MKFYIKQKVFSLRDRFQVLDAEQQPVYQVQGKMFSLSNKLDLMRPDGTPVLHAHRKVFTFLPKYFIESPTGDSLAVVQRRFGLRPKFDVTLGTEQLQVSGSLFAHSFQVMDERGIVASIQKKIISWGDTYEIEIQDDRRIELLLFVVIIIDQVIHEQKNRGSSN
jgi:uncharacterized protein YxjI